MRWSTQALTGAVSVLAFGALTPAAQADVPHGRSFDDLARFGQMSCLEGGDVVSDDLIVNPGGGDVAWLPDGTHLVGTSFSMYDAAGSLILTKTYGSESHQEPEVTCTSTGIDPDSGAIVTVVFTAVTTS